MTSHTPPTLAKGRPILFLDGDSAIHAQAIRRFNDAEWTVIVMRHLSLGEPSDEATLQAALRELQAEASAHGAHIDGVYVCPPTVGTDRAPVITRFQQALDAQERVPTNCVAVGDKLAHLEPARRIGCRTVLVETGYGIALAASPQELPFRPDVILPDLEAVADWALKSG